MRISEEKKRCSKQRSCGNVRSSFIHCESWSKLWIASSKGQWDRRPPKPSKPYCLSLHGYLTRGWIRFILGVLTGTMWGPILEITGTASVNLQSSFKPSNVPSKAQVGRRSICKAVPLRTPHPAGQLWHQRGASRLWHRTHMTHFHTCYTIHFTIRYTIYFRMVLTHLCTYCMYEWDILYTAIGNRFAYHSFDTWIS